MRVNYRPATTWTALALLLLAVAAGAQAQGGGSSPAAAAPSKVGTLNVRQAIINTAEGKQASAELQSQFSARQNDLDNVRKQIEDLQNRLRSGERTLSEDEKARLTRQGELFSRQYQRKQDDLQEELNAAQAEVIDRIGRKMLDVLGRYARENGYTVVFDTSGQNSPVLYATTQVDLTQDIIRLYDQAYPVKAAAPTPAAPARPQPKPVQPLPTTQPPPTQPPAKKP
jgi:outer membrane protein